MQTEHHERRQGSRWIPIATDPLSRVRLRLGRELSVINVSTSGVLVHGPARLFPGTHVDVHVTASQGRVLIRARVVRCAVWDLAADDVQYRGALAFNTPVDLQPTDLAAMPLFTDSQAAENLHGDLADAELVADAPFVQRTTKAP